MPDIRYVYLSDMHLGEEDSYWFFNYKMQKIFNHAEGTK